MRKARVDSAEEQVRIAAAARQPIVPPSNVPLDARDKPFFVNIIAEFARSEWTAHQLELVAMLARTMADLEDEQREFRREGSVVQCVRGPVTNPRFGVIQGHVNLIISLRRSLALNGRVKNGEPLHAAKRRVQIMEIERDNAADDDLIASPAN